MYVCAVTKANKDKLFLCSFVCQARDSESFLTHTSLQEPRPTVAMGSPFCEVMLKWELLGVRRNHPCWNQQTSRGSSMCKGPESSQELDIFKELKQDQVSCSILSKWEMAGLDRSLQGHSGDTSRWYNRQTSTVRCTKIIPNPDSFHLLCPLPGMFFLQNVSWLSCLLFSSNATFVERLPASLYKLVSLYSVPLSHFIILFSSWHLSLPEVDLLIYIFIICLPHKPGSSKKAEIIFF